MALKIDAGATTLDAHLCELIKQRFSGQTAFTSDDVDWAQNRHIEFLIVSLNEYYWGDERGIINGTMIHHHYVKKVIQMLYQGVETMVIQLNSATISSNVYCRTVTNPAHNDDTNAAISNKKDKGCCEHGNCLKKCVPGKLGKPDRPRCFEHQALMDDFAAVGSAMVCTFYLQFYPTHQRTSRQPSHRGVCLVVSCDHIGLYS